MNFDWSDSPPDPSLQSYDFSVRWSGWVLPRYTETYTFSTVSDDGVRLWVNNQLLIDNWTDHDVGTDSATFALVAGQKSELKVEYYEDGTPDGIIQLLWSSASQAEEVIPQDQLYPSLPTLLSSHVDVDSNDIGNTIGDLCPSSLSGFVYVDDNDNGVRDAGEAGIAGVPITLTGTDDLGQAVSLTSTTAADGMYRFDGLRPGSYAIRASQPPAYRKGKASLGSLGGTAEQDQFFIALGTGGIGVNYNFGQLLVPPAPQSVESPPAASRQGQDIRNFADATPRYIILFSDVPKTASAPSASEMKTSPGNGISDDWLRMIPTKAPDAITLSHVTEQGGNQDLRHSRATADAPLRSAATAPLVRSGSSGSMINSPQTNVSEVMPQTGPMAYHNVPYDSDLGNGEHPGKGLYATMPENQVVLTATKDGRDDFDTLPPTLPRVGNLSLSSDEPGAVRNRWFIPSIWLLSTMLLEALKSVLGPSSSPGAMHRKV